MKSEVRSSLFFGIVAILSSVSAPAFAGLENSALDASKNISKAVQFTAEKIDLTLAGNRYTDRSNDSQVTVSQLVTWTEGGIVKPSTDFGLNLRLPNVEKRWQLRFASYDEEQEERDMNQRHVRTTPRQREYGASVFLLRKLGEVKVTFQPKLQLKDPLEMTYVLRLESGADLYNFRIAPKLELYADATKGTGEYFGLNFIYRFRKTLEAALENEEEYREKAHSFSTRHGLSLDYAYTESDKFGTALIFGSDNHNFHLSGVTYSVSYWHEIYKKLLSCTTAPFWGFAKSDHFKGKVGISFNLVASF